MELNEFPVFKENFVQRFFREAVFPFDPMIKIAASVVLGQVAGVMMGWGLYFANWVLLVSGLVLLVSLVALSFYAVHCHDRRAKYYIALREHNLTQAAKM